MDLVPFATWKEVLTWGAAGKPLFYQAPLNVSPVRLWPGEITPADAHGRGKERTGDPFTADAGHLSRFLRPAPVGPHVDGVTFIRDTDTDAAYVSETAVASSVADRAVAELRTQGWTVSLAPDDCEQWIYVGWKHEVEPS